jgi:predicted transcriptional regulator
MVPELKTKSAIASHFKLPLTLVSECLDFLITAGLAEFENGKYKVGSKRIHLSKDSPMISKHHTNWRMKAIQVYDRKSKDDLHFSGPMCISQDDALQVKEALLKTLESIEPTIAASKEENVFCLAIDFFQV